MKKSYFFFVVFIFSFFSVACGGEEECSGSDCYEPVDEISTTDENEVSDETTDKVTDETIDETVDETADEVVDEDEEVLETPQELLDLVGNLVSIDGSGVEGTLTVTPRTNDFEIKIRWTKGMEGENVWYGLELPLTLWHEETGNYMTLRKTGENIIRESSSIDHEVFMTLVLKKIQ